MKRFTAQTLVSGTAEGMTLVSRKAFTFAHGVDPSTGGVTDVHSDIVGRNVRGQILVYPHGKGSTTASAWLLETVRLGNAPAAILTRSVDLSAVIGSVMSGILYGKNIPVMSSLEEGLFSIASGVRASVDSNGLTLESEP